MEPRTHGTPCCLSGGCGSAPEMLDDDGCHPAVRAGRSVIRVWGTRQVTCRMQLKPHTPQQLEDASCEKEL
jgi:hypothetical protein